jgi:hypothetical protein
VYMRAAPRVCVLFRAAGSVTSHGKSKITQMVAKVSVQ